MPLTNTYKRHQRFSLLQAVGLLLLALHFSAHASSTPPGSGPTKSQPIILVVGDSLSAGYGIELDEGWVQRLANHLRQSVSEGVLSSTGYKVINASISGETSGGGLRRLPHLLTQHKPDIVIIELGGNDGLRGYPISQIRDNVSQMVTLSQQVADHTLLLGMQIPPNYGPRYSRQFYASFQYVADQHNIPLVPFLLENVALNPDLMQSDGLHPNADAQGLILQNVLKQLKPLL